MDTSKAYILTVSHRFGKVVEHVQVFLNKQEATTFGQLHALDYTDGLPAHVQLYEQCLGRTSPLEGFDVLEVPA